MTVSEKAKKIVITITWMNVSAEYLENVINGGSVSRSGRHRLGFSHEL